MGNTLESIANQPRGATDPEGFRDRMLSLMFLRYLPTIIEGAQRLEGRIALKPEPQLAAFQRDDMVAPLL